jgi:hypothetical protein
MKRIDRIKKEAEITMDKIRGLTRHIRNVEDNCLVLGEKLIENGQIDLGRQLIANGYVHDTSKFYGIEFDNLSSSEPSDIKQENAKLKMRMAIQHHQKTNKHHPESWAGGIRDMPEVYLAEFCCDAKARSEEFGTDLRQWVNEISTKKYNFCKDDMVYNKIMIYINLLCPPPFKEIK